MTAYYIDPHKTTTGGAGTWADPLAPLDFTNSTTTNVISGFADGDELRFKGVALTDLLTSTEYTGTYSSTYYRINMTDTSDFAQHDLIYFPDLDLFQRVYSVSTNNYISIYSDHIMYPSRTVSIGDSVTIRKVDTTTYPEWGSTSNLYFIRGNNTNGWTINVSDGWTADGTQVTDGTVKTIFASTYTSNNSYYFGNSNANDGADSLQSVTLDMRNTHFLPSRGTSSHHSYFYGYTRNSTVRIGQLSGNRRYSGYMYVWGYNNDYYVKHCHVRVTLGQNSNAGSSGKNRVHLTNHVRASSDYFYGNNYGDSNEIFTENYHCYSISESLIRIQNTGNYGNTRFNYKQIMVGAKTNYTSSTSLNSQYLFGRYGPDDILQFDSDGVNITWGDYSTDSGTATNFRGLLYAYYWKGAQDYSVTLVREPTTGNITWQNQYAFSYAPSSSEYHNAFSAVQPNEYALAVPDNKGIYPDIFGGANTFNFYGHYGYNMLFTSLDGSIEPIEYLGLFNKGGTQTSSSRYPRITRDFLVYKTESPSLKVNLPTWSTNPWGPNTRSKKIIKIPVVDGTAITVTGYIRSDNSTYSSGDVIAELIGKGSVQVTDTISSCFNTWEQFSLTYTPDYTGEAFLAISMHFPKATSYYIDDIAVA